jgi:hypothetical protein
VKVVSELEFMSEFRRRTSDDFWKHVNSIQTCVRSKIGCGEPIIINFLAPICANDPAKEIEYDYRAIGKDSDLLRVDDKKYCLKQCYKMCYYASKIYNYVSLRVLILKEILKMRAEFIKDETGAVSSGLLILNRFGFSLQKRFMLDLLEGRLKFNLPKSKSNRNNKSNLIAVFKKVKMELIKFSI